MMLQFAQPDDVSKQITPSGKKTVAALVTGKFKTAFPDGPPKEEKPADDASKSDDAKKEEPKKEEPKASDFLKALSHEARLVILCLLVEGEKSVAEIEQMLSLRQPAVSQQLARLRADDLVEARRDGKNIYYSLARPEVREIIEALHSAFCRPRRSR